MITSYLRDYFGGLLVFDLIVHYLEQINSRHEAHFPHQSSQCFHRPVDHRQDYQNLNCIKFLIVICFQVSSSDERIKAQSFVTATLIKRVICFFLYCIERNGPILSKRCLTLKIFFSILVFVRRWKMVEPLDLMHQNGFLCDR